ncbi:MAG: Ureidoglycolate hydrolase [Moorea sp. SIO1F2]|uniref:Ureidoglycolate hydrolase n=1 Tax=Moorena bouillonii PNG TaxID=568701 RepID=A0A1U7N8E1_9CYAN|nr:MULTISPECIES: ureidoglycolate lyase [Moorena]NEN96153.1 Ureidoglycolate hydrolase [Moorena sp. SIO3I7]NEO67454.1 Ureidoglycolate hydrolase [Moorena sp. SIO4G2]NEO04592.1 Ureidoglycolate hydrolase [Moorena sp. SIO3I8]NEO23320.1 Ureidoglycolate hydrolase [Moorena sp. SIO4A5]NEP21204.1 Ureidoglycolate hydrolase [Moorena sp. SIO3I6]
MSKVKTIQKLHAEWVTSENFQPYGQVIFASEDGKPYDQDDAQLNLDNGTSRFYIMRLHHKGRKFDKITRHVQCTQCLGSLEGKDWFMAVAPPTQDDQPVLEDIAAFRIPGNCFIKLEVGTWHAGPYFDQEFIDFYNLELADTNVVDHFTHDFIDSHQLQFEIVIAKGTAEQGVGSRE